MAERPEVISTLIMQRTLDLIHELHTGLKRDDTSRLELVEIRPKSEGFADAALSCSISPNDPADPDNWLDEENMAESSFRYNSWSGTKFTEMGLGQYFNLRFTIDFTLFFQELGLTRDEALESANLILARIHQGVMLAGAERGGKYAGLKDSFGTKVISPQGAVKKRRMLPRGSDEEPIYRGKMWLQFACYMEP